MNTPKNRSRRGRLSPVSADSSGRRAGFVLRDAVALAGAFALLCALAIPMVANTHAGSHLTVCSGNLRQLLVAGLLYGQDYRDAFLGTSYVPANGGFSSLSAGGFWPSPAAASDRSRRAALNAVSNAFAAGPLWPYLKSVPVVHCPADQRMDLFDPGRGWGYDSYSKSDALGSGEFINTFQPYLRIAEVPDPGMSFLFCEEADPRGYNLGNWVLGTSPLGWVDGFGAFHDGGAQFAYLDGHAEFHRWQDARTLAVSKSMTTGHAAFYWPGGTFDNPDFRWVYDRYQFKGWKPAP